MPAFDELVSEAACAASLRAAHDTPQMWPVAVRQRRFLLIATKPR